MILIGDAGATKTDWRLVDKGKIHQFSQNGFNATTHDVSVFLSESEKCFSNVITDINQVFLYCAGLMDSNKEFIRAALKNIFSHSEISAESDQLGAARSLFGRSPGRVCILGTGSGGCIYDGEVIKRRIPSLGYLLGDEGSGVHLGRKLVTKYLRDQLGGELISLFHQQFGELSEVEILKKVYSTNSATYLASFSSFLIEHQSHPELFKLIYAGFQDYFDAYWEQVEPDDLSYGFTGSIAYLLSNVLRKSGSDRGIHIELISQSPIAGLTLYHQQK